MSISKKAKQYTLAIATLFLLASDEIGLKAAFADASNHFLRGDKRDLGVDKAFVCHTDQTTGWRKTLSVAEHGAVAHTEKHKDKMGKCSAVRQGIINDYISTNCSNSSSSTTDLCTEMTFNGLELDGETLSPFEGCSEQVKTLNATIELDFTFWSEVEGSKAQGNETLLQDDCDSGSPCWPYLCNLRNKTATLRVQATDLTCNSNSASTESRCDRDRINLLGSKRDVFLTRTTWKACGTNKLLEPFPDYGLEFFKMTIEPPVDTYHPDMWCISIQEKNEWYYEEAHLENETGCLESEGYPKFYAWSQRINFHVPFSVSVGVGGGTPAPVATEFGPYGSYLIFGSHFFDDHDDFPSFASPTNFYDSSLFFNCTFDDMPLGDTPVYCRTTKYWQARISADKAGDPYCHNLERSGSWYSSLLLPYTLNSIKISQLGE